MIKQIRLKTAGRPLKYNELLAQTLVSEFKAGKKPAFAALWEMAGPIIQRLLKRGLDKHTASDLAGQVCLVLFETGIREYEPAKCSFITWIYRLSLNKKLDELKRARPLSLEELDEQMPAEGFKVTGRAGADSRTPLDILIDREDEALKAQALELLPKLLAELSPDEQFVLYSSIYDNRTDKEISLALDGRADASDKYRKIRERALRRLGGLFALKGIRRVTLNN